MSSTPTEAEIAQDARWLTQAFDPAAKLVRLIAMTADNYRSASFLDDRMVQQPVEAVLVPWATVAAAAAGITRTDARWIFHIGHVGSTLVARLLGELPTVLSVREPRFLRDLAALGPDDRKAIVPLARALFSRSFGASQTALVKATSFVSEIAAELVPPDGRALFLYAAPRHYIASILAGDNSVRELHALAPARARRMAGRVPDIRPPRNDAERAAAAWACEMTSLEAASEALPNARILWLDFDRMLDDVGGCLRRTANDLAIDASAGKLAALAASPLLTRYSKAPEHGYSAELRHDLIAESAAHFASDIDGALDLLAQSAETSPSLAQALSRAGEN